VGKQTGTILSRSVTKTPANSKVVPVPKHRSMTLWRRTKVKLEEFLTSALERAAWLASRSGYFTLALALKWLVDWVNPKFCLDKKPPCRLSNFSLSVCNKTLQ
jgi:hypothetical protein